MIYGSVCSGIEAASACVYPLGCRASFLSEIEAFPRAVLKHHYPTVPLHGDFTTIRAGEYEPIDVFRLEAHLASHSALRDCAADQQTSAVTSALEYLRPIERTAPQLGCFGENVPGVLSFAWGRTGLWVPFSGAGLNSGIKGGLPES